MPLSLEKTVVMYGWHHQPLYTYKIDGLNLSTVDSFVDLGVHGACAGDYAGHLTAVAAKASRISGVIRRAFRIKPLRIDVACISALRNTHTHVRL